MRKPLLLISLFAGAVSACSSSSPGAGDGGQTVNSQSAPLTGNIVAGSGMDAPGFGGPGAVHSTVNVSAMTIDAGGSTTSVAQAAVGAGGSYSLDVPVHAGPTLVQALDASGKVVASAILEDTLVAGQAVTVQPMTTESSVEAAVLLQMTASGTALTSVDLVALRARIDAGTAAVVQAHAADQASTATADIKALTVAALAAQASQSASLQAAKVDATAYAAAELKAADALTTALNANASASGTVQANATFTAAMATLGSQFGMDAASSASAATNASASAQQAIAAGSSSADLTGAFDVTQAMLESLATTAALTEAFTNASAPATVMEQLQTTNTNLVTSVGSAANAGALTSAFATWRASVQGPSGLVAAILGSGITATPAYTTMLSSLTTVDGTLQASLAASAAASKDAAGVIDPTKLASLVAQAYATFDASVQTTVTGSGGVFVGSDGTLMTSALVASQGSF